MCLGVPMQVKTIENEMATCEIDGVQREASLMMIDGVRVGDYVLIHAGFAIEKIDEVLRMLDVSMLTLIPQTHIVAELTIIRKELKAFN